MDRKMRRRCEATIESVAATGTQTTEAMRALGGELRAIVGAAHVLDDADRCAPYERDVTGRFGARSALVVRPADAAEVAAVVTACARAGVAIVPQGGNSGLVGGGVPRGGEVLVSLRRLDDVVVDATAGQLEAGAGATLATLQAAAHAAGFAFGVDLAARDSATVGGLVATDAGGAWALRHGTMRAQVVGLEAVLADGGRVARLSGLVMDNAGYDTSALLVGSEGTLGVITRARLRLLPALPARVTALFALPGLPEAVRLLGRLRARVPSLAAADFYGDDGLELALAQRRATHPLTRRGGAYVVVDCAAVSDPTAELAAAVEDADEVLEVAVADDTTGRHELWRPRDAQHETVAALGIPHKLDVAVPLARLAAFVEDVRATVARLDPRWTVLQFGHLGDGNVHVNVVGPEPEDARVDVVILELAAAPGGTISAEHGVGVAKARYLPLVRSPRELAAMRAIKRAFDPAGLLNPGVLLHDPSRRTRPLREGA
jgi:FAD/FMN-containing dehydrogenase